jgi:hypothetical protein
VAGCSPGWGPSIFPFNYPRLILSATHFGGVPFCFASYSFQNSLASFGQLEILLFMKEDESIAPPDDSLTPSRVRFDSFLPRSESKLVFAFVMACYSWTLSSLLGALFRAFSARRPPTGLFTSSTSPSSALEKSIGVLIFSPVFESLLLVAIIEILRGLRFPVGFQIFIAALVLCLSHSISWLPWGVIVAPGFTLGAFAYTRWRSTSKQTALGITILIHLLHNSIPAISDVARAFRNARAGF